MKVLIADDQADVRSALRVLLEHQPDIDIAGEAYDMDSLLSAIKNSQPELLLLDWELPGIAANRALPAIRELKKGLRIVAMSVSPEAARNAMDTGVDAFVSKGENSDGLLGVINKMKGRI